MNLVERFPYYSRERYKNIEIIIFEEHNKALPIWGMYSSKVLMPCRLITFDYHTDTMQPFRTVPNESFAVDDAVYDFKKRKYKEQVLRNRNYKRDNFVFNDVIELCNKIANDEHIKTAVDFGYLCKYTVIHKEDHANDYARYDQLDGYLAKYINSHDFNSMSITDIESLEEDALILDFDLDYFNSRVELNDDFFSKITPLVRNVRLITIARENWWFNKCNKEDGFTNEEAESLLILGIKSILDEQ